MQAALASATLARMAALLLAILAAPNPAYAPIEDDPALPRVMLIGDSISIGYTLPVREKLAGIANVHRPPENCGPTTRGIERLDRWLGEKPWDVIHFNFGLHDLKFVDEAGKRATPDTGAYQVSLDDYRQNLTTIAQKLKATGATVIWRNTTPVPAGTKIRIEGDEQQYNAVAADVMPSLDILTHDLHTYAREHAAEIQKPADVHYTASGSDQLAGEVARVIREALEARATP